jgi:hypothetical protein
MANKAGEGYGFDGLLSLIASAFIAIIALMP